MVKGLGPACLVVALGEACLAELRSLCFPHS